ncbi:hypothetical protein D3C80_2032890 [compost metagenome]
MYFVELETALEERLERNKTPHRLQHKPSKRDTARSEQNLLTTMEQHRLNSHEGEITRERYIRIDNTHLSADEAAQRIKEEFQL